MSHHSWLASTDRPGAILWSVPGMQLLLYGQADGCGRLACWIGRPLIGTAGGRDAVWTAGRTACLGFSP